MLTSDSKIRYEQMKKKLDFPLNSNKLFISYRWLWQIHSFETYQIWWRNEKKLEQSFVEYELKQNHLHRVWLVHECMKMKWSTKFTIVFFYPSKSHHGTTFHARKNGTNSAMQFKLMWITVIFHLNIKCIE